VRLGPQGELFDIPSGVTYLNCAYMAPQLRSVTEAGLSAVPRKSAPWTVPPRAFFDDSERLRSTFASVAGVDADAIALVPSVSYGIGTAVANVEITAGQTVVVLAEQFPSNVYPWRAAVAASGAEVVTVERPGDGDWTAAVTAAIDERTAVVAVPQCHWTDGSIVDLVAVGAAVRDVGAALVVDATQSFGAVPFDIEAVRPDFLVTAGYKWLLGPYSLGYLYVAPHRRDGVPLEHNWISRAGSDNFAALVDYNDEPAAGARRFDVGERSNFVLVPMALAALEQITAWGVPAIASTLADVTAAIASGAADLGYRSAPADQRGPHLLGLRHPSGVPAGLAARLAEQQIYVSIRGDSIRVSPHLYNTADDVSRLLSALA
jgi:selenocysteine lyase/cysteine desulfurase